MSDGCVTSRFKMLTYYRVRSLFEAAQALPSNMMCGFQTRFGSILTDTSAFGGLGFATFFRKVAKKKIQKILPASPTWSAEVLTKAEALAKAG